MYVTVQEINQLISENKTPYLIDVREVFEHEEFNIGGRNIPLTSLPGFLKEIQAHKNEDVVVYCRSGGRSSMAQSILMQNGFMQVKNLVGGVMAWKEMEDNSMV